MQSISRIVTTPKTPPPARRRAAIPPNRATLRRQGRATAPPPVPHGNTLLQRSTPARIMQISRSHSSTGPRWTSRRAPHNRPEPPKKSATLSAQ